MTSLRIARTLALPLAAVSVLAATAFAQPTSKAQNPKPPVVGAAGQGAAGGMAPQAPNNPDGPVPPRGPAAPTGYAGTATTGPCTTGFSKIAQAMNSKNPQQYESYTCEGQAPMCIEAKAAAEKGPSLLAVNREGGGGIEGGNGSFLIRANYEVKYAYNCALPVQCLSAASQGATGVAVEVKRGFIGTTVTYKCSYPKTAG